MDSGTLGRCSLPHLAFAFLLVAICACGEEVPKAASVPDRVRVRLQSLIAKYYPKATFTNQDVNGIGFEHEVTRFEFPYIGRPNAKHEATVQRGPKKGGILCNVYLQKGSYEGQILLWSRSDGQVASALIDRKVYKQMVMAPYSPKRDVHLWVSLSFPSDATEEFLKQFRAIMTDFQNDAE